MNFERALIDLLQRGVVDLIREIREMNKNLEYIGCQIEEMKIGIDALVEQGDEV